MPLLSVFSTSGQPSRDILIPGRNPLRAYGAVRISSNSARRQESDWPAIKACIQAGDVVIELSHYEVDALPEHLTGNIAFGGNVRFDAPRPPRWRMVPDGGMVRFETQLHPCKEEGCSQGFDTGLDLGRHKRAAHRAPAKVAV